MKTEIDKTQRTRKKLEILLILSFMTFILISSFFIWIQFFYKIEIIKVYEKHFITPPWFFNSFLYTRLFYIPLALYFAALIRINITRETRHFGKLTTYLYFFGVSALVSYLHIEVFLFFVFIHVLIGLLFRPKIIQLYWKHILVISVVVIFSVIVTLLNIYRCSSDIEKAALHSTVMTQMNIVRLAMEDFATENDDVYPCSFSDTTKNGKKFQEFISENLFSFHDTLNPYTKRHTDVIFKGKLFPDMHGVIRIPPGDIFIFCNGSKFMILGGREDGKSLSLRLTDRGRKLH